MEMTRTLFRQASRCLVRPTSADISVLLMLIVLVRVNTQCPQCTGQFIKIINGTTGECIRCFPCPRCEDEHTSSVPCGTTAPYGTHITCVSIQSDPITATSSSASVTFSITKQATTEKKKDGRALSLEEWKKHTMIHLLSGIFLAVTSFAIVYRVLKWKSSKQIQQHIQPVNLERHPTLSTPDVSAQDNGTCNISFVTNTVTYRHHNGHAAEMGDRSQESQLPGVAHPLSSFDTAVNVVQLPTQSVPHPLYPQPLVDFTSTGSRPVTGGSEQQTSVSWSALPQMQKYQTKVLMLPFSLLNKICLTLDASRPDGNDVRMLAEKCGISLSDLALLKQAAITQSPDNVCCNALTYFVLKSKKALITVGEFVNIMKAMERDDIVSLINAWH